MQQRQKRFYILQDEDQAVVRSVPIARRAQAVLAPEERTSAPAAEQADQQDRPASVADRVRAVVRRTSAGGRR